MFKFLSSQITPSKEIKIMKCLQCGKGYRISRASKQFCNDNCRYDYHNTKKRVQSLVARSQTAIDDLLNLIADHPVHEKEAYEHLVDLFNKLENHEIIQAIYHDNISHDK